MFLKIWEFYIFCLTIETKIKGGGKFDTHFDPPSDKRVLWSAPVLVYPQTWADY